MRALHAAKEAPESEFAERVASADRTGAAASPDEWTYIHAFCGLDAGREAFAPLGGRPAGACDVSVSVRKLWNHLTGLQAEPAKKPSSEIAPCFMNVTTRALVSRTRR